MNTTVNNSNNATTTKIEGTNISVTVNGDANINIAGDIHFKDLNEKLEGLNQREEIKRLFIKGKKRAERDSITDANAGGEVSEEDIEEETEIEVTDEELETLAGYKPPKKWSNPSVKALSNNARWLAETSDGSCRLYENGFASYKNIVGRMTVVWVPGCAEYRAGDGQKAINARDEDGNDILTVDDELGKAPWFVAVTTTGEAQIMARRFHSKADRDENRADDVEIEETSKYTWTAGSKIEAPEKAMLKHEYFRSLMDKLTETQAQRILLYYVFGYNETEISRGLGKAQNAIRKSVESAEEKIGDYGMKFLDFASGLEVLSMEYLPESMVKAVEDAADRMDRKRVSYRVRGRRNA